MQTKPKVLLIHTEAVVREYLSKQLVKHCGVSLVTAENASGGLEASRRESFDVVLADFGVSDLDGLSLVKSLKIIDADCVIIAFVRDSDYLIVKGIGDIGIFDVVAKPINIERLCSLVDKGIEFHSILKTQRRLVEGLKEQNSFLQKQNVLLVKRIEDSAQNLTRLYGDLRQTYMRTIKVLAQAIDARDHYTHSHSENVVTYAAAIAEEMKVSAEEVEMIREACSLHDLGKIGVEDCILGKPTALTPAEWEQIKRHPQTAAQILAPLPFLNGVIDLIKQHHEHYDGSGYPAGLKADDILLGSRIIHVADAYEAMRSPRSYRKNPLLKEEAVKEITTHSGTQFDPAVVAAFLKVVDRF